MPGSPAATPEGDCIPARLARGPVRRRARAVRTPRGRARPARTGRPWPGNDLPCGTAGSGSPTGVAPMATSRAPASSAASAAARRSAVSSARTSARWVHTPVTISTMLRRTAWWLWPRTPSDSAAVTCSATGRFTPVSGSTSRNSSSTPTVNAAGSTAAVEPAAVAKVDATGHRPSSGKHRCGDGGTPGYPATLRANTPVPRGDRGSPVPESDHPALYRSGMSASRDQKPASGGREERP